MQDFSLTQPASRITKIPFITGEEHMSDAKAPKLLGHEDVSTTMIYTHVLNKGGKGVSSPLDRIAHLPGKGSSEAKKERLEIDSQE
jgi:hypothetical protein